MLYANCLPVIGASNAIVCDLQNSVYYPIPKDLALLLQNEAGNTLLWFETKYSAKDYQVIKANFDFLAQHGLGFYTQNKDQFPKLSEEWYDPGLINNAVIDISKESSHHYEKIAKELINAGCRHLQLRFFQSVTYNELLVVIESISKVSFRSIELLFRDFKSKRNHIEAVIDLYPQIMLVIVGNQNKHYHFDYKGTKVLLVTEDLRDDTVCGQVSTEYFTVNTSSFAESKRFNSCLNKKVGIDRQGNVKNCPSCTACFGKANDVDFQKTLQQESFQRLWHITKDHIAVCKDCEFRYICPDCRAFTVDEDELGKPQKCGYDPYQGVWE